MPNITPNLGLTTYNAITDASSVLLYDYIDAVSGSRTTENLGKLDRYAGEISGSIGTMSNPQPYVPVFLSTGATFTSSGSGYYSIIGKTVFVEAKLECNSISGTTTNQVLVTLPFSAKTIGFTVPFSITHSKITFGNDARGISGFIQTGASAVGLWQTFSGSTVVTLSASNVNATGGIVYLNGSYFID
jgi:hypothetical protein